MHPAAGITLVTAANSLWCVTSTPCPLPQISPSPLLAVAGALDCSSTHHLPHQPGCGSFSGCLKKSKPQKPVEILELPQDMVRELAADLNSYSSRQHQCLKHKVTLPFSAMGSTSGYGCLNGLWSRHRKQNGLWVKAKQRVTKVRAGSLPAVCS